MSEENIPLNRERILTDAGNRLSAAGGNIALCEHCRNVMDYTGLSRCQSCRRLDDDAASADFRAENRRMVKIFALILLFGAVAIALLSYLAKTRL